MFSFVKSRPPLVVFFLCILTIAITIFCFAFYIKHTDPIPDTDKNHDWLVLLKHFNSLETCIESNGEAPKEVKEKDFIEITTVQTLVNINNTDLFKKFTSIKGFLTLEEWHTNCPKNYEKPAYLEIHFDIPDIARTNVTQFDACATIKGPEEYLPKLLEPTCDKMERKNEKISEAYLSTVTTKSNDFCKNGLLTKILFYPQGQNNFANYLSDNEKSLIYVHLLWTSYFLIFILLIIVIYGTFQSEYIFDKYLQKFTSHK